MKRNNKEDKEKYLKRIRRRSSEVGKIARELDWVPVEEPQFMGWEVSLTLSESRLRSRDAEELIQVMDILNMRKPTFTRYPRISRFIKMCGGRYEATLDEVKRYYKARWNRWYSDWSHIGTRYLPYFEDNSISEERYQSLPGNLKKYFGGSSHDATYWRPAYKTYGLAYCGGFPRYELRLVCKKSYSTHRGVPRMEAQKEEQFLDDILSRELYWSKYTDHGGYDAWYHKMQNRTMRKSWNQGLIVLAKRYDSETAEEVVEYTEKVVSSRANYDTW